MRYLLTPIPSRIRLMLLSIFFLLTACFVKRENTGVTSPSLDFVIPTGGNSWIMNTSDDSDDIITENGIQNWQDPRSRIRTFFRVAKTGSIEIAIRARATAGASSIKCTFGNVSKEINLTNTDFETVVVGNFDITEPGYQWLEMQGIAKTSDTFAEVSDVLIGGSATQGEVYFVKDEFYWARRGPSVHLSYDVPKAAQEVQWFYNEITVPEGNDVIGSYFMANGFAEGYFGIQVNSPTERRILFSVWSPYETDDPASIPEDFKIKLLKKGKGVYTGEFGNEGSGGQSYLQYFWQAGTTYRFLLKGEPAGNNATDYTAYFFAPEVGNWELIASFRRPKTNTYLNGLYSFLENFIPETGYITRGATYSNQWVLDNTGKWYELNRAQFTADATARKDARLDYAGGVEGKHFFLKNCGFFNNRTTIDSFFTRTPSGKAPDIDFSKLE